MAEGTPVQEASALLDKQMSKGEVTRELEKRGYTLQQISDAINQSEIKQGVTGGLDAPTGMPQEQMVPPGMESSEQGLDIPFPQQGQRAASQPSMQDSVQKYSQQDPNYTLPQQEGMGYSDMQAVVEQIFEEKWRAMMQDVGNISVFKARMSDDLEAVKQELLRTQRRLEDLQVAVLGKVKDYDQSVQNIGADMKALEQVFAKIMAPLTSNVKELSRLTEDLRKKKK